MSSVKGMLDDKAQVVVCGHSHSNPDVEAQFVAMRLEKGDIEPEGCGKTLHWSWAYRCLDCARWMHQGCLVKHFAKHGDESRLAAETLRAETRRALDVLRPGTYGANHLPMCDSILWHEPWKEQDPCTCGLQPARDILSAALGEEAG